MKDFKDFKFNTSAALLVAIVLALPLALYVAYQYRTLSKDFLALSSENVQLSIALDNAKIENASHLRYAEEQQTVINSFTGQIEDISSTVGTLDKLAKTDKELLKKYSKIYFLNENYIPAKLIDIDEDYAFKQTSGNLQINTDVWPYLKELIDEAREDNVELQVVSAFRSFNTQASLKAEYRFIYGAGTANQFSADQGYSEHQLGTSVDLTTPEAGAAFSKFSTGKGYDWLLENAHKYGFILSYPAGNTYYTFEPWHWRYVGVALATDLHEMKKHFYDLDQREIDKYLIKLFP